MSGHHIFSIAHVDRRQGSGGTMAYYAYVIGRTVTDTHGKIHNSRHQDDEILCHLHLTPHSAPLWAKDPVAVCTACDDTDDEYPAWNLFFQIPPSVPRDKIRNFIYASTADISVVAPCMSVGVHYKPGALRDDEPYIHAHCIVPRRRILDDGFADAPDRALDKAMEAKTDGLFVAERDFRANAVAWLETHDYSTDIYRSRPDPAEDKIRSLTRTLAARDAEIARLRDSLSAALHRAG